MIVKKYHDGECVGFEEVPDPVPTPQEPVKLKAVKPAAKAAKEKK